MPTVAILGLTAVLLAIVAMLLTILLLRERKTGDEFDPDRLTVAMNRSMDDLQLREAVDRVEQQAEAIGELHTDLDRLLRNPQQRGSFGETQLEVLLADHLPEHVYGLDEAVVGQRRPDAHVETVDGIVCIDSKFPLEQYRLALDAEGERERERHERAFREAVGDHLAAIAEKYVRPEDGTTPFAFAFIPSERVYHHLVTNEAALVREFGHEGVLVVSPLTLGPKLELIRAGVHAAELNDRAAQVEAELQRIGQRVDAVLDVWTVLQGHLENASARANELDGELGNLDAAFGAVEDLAPDPDDASRSPSASKRP